MSTRLAKWAEWAKSRAVKPTLSKKQRRICSHFQDVQFASTYDRAEVAGVPFACEGIQKRAKSKTCTVMVAKAGGAVDIGQVRTFLKWQPPWSQSRDERLELADVQWYESKGSNARLAGAPQVSKAFKSDPRGN